MHDLLSGSYSIECNLISQYILSSPHFLKQRISPSTRQWLSDFFTFTWGILIGAAMSLSECYIRILFYRCLNFMSHFKFRSFHGQNENKITLEYSDPLLLAGNAWLLEYVTKNAKNNLNRAKINSWIFYLYWQGCYWVRWI